MTGAAKACRLVTAIFAALYVLALGLLTVGTSGLFGQPRDPLSGVFLIPLGLLWNRMIDAFPEAAGRRCDPGNRIAVCSLGELWGGARDALA